MRLPNWSLKYRFSLESTATPCETPIPACTDGPPSPVYASVPLPATVAIVPSTASTRRTLYKSAMKRLPFPSTATAEGKFRFAAVAAPPSPQAAAGLAQGVPLPATVLIIPLAFTARTRAVPASAIYVVAPLTASPRKPAPLKVACSAGPPSPQVVAGLQIAPVPAYASIFSLAGSTRRTRKSFPYDMRSPPEASRATLAGPLKFACSAIAPSPQELVGTVQTKPFPAYVEMS